MVDAHLSSITFIALIESLIIKEKHMKSFVNSLVDQH